MNVKFLNVLLCICYCVLITWLHASWVRNFPMEPCQLFPVVWPVDWWLMEQGTVEPTQRSHKSLQCLMPNCIIYLFISLKVSVSFHCHLQLEFHYIFLQCLFNDCNTYTQKCAWKQRIACFSYAFFSYFCMIFNSNYILSVVREFTYRFTFFTYFINEGRRCLLFEDVFL